MRSVITGVHKAKTGSERAGYTRRLLNPTQKETRRTYACEIAIQDAKHDDASDRMHTDHPKKDDGTTKCGDDDHGGDAEVPNEDGRTELADKTRGVHDHELAWSSTQIRIRGDGKGDATE